VSNPLGDPKLASASATRSLLERSSERSEGFREAFRCALLAVPAAQRDAWLDLVLGIEGVPEDGPELPRGCVPYLPCPVSALLHLIEHAQVRSSDVFIDIGSGLGRAMLLTHLLTGATAIGFEIQPHLVRTARDLARRLQARCTVVPGDAARLGPELASGTVFFLYCPFSGERLANLLDALEAIARTRAIRVCSLDLPLPPRPWLTRLELPFDNLAVYSSSARPST
jgi:hypothetical protein